MLIILTSNDEPPYEKNGSVTPVTGISEVTTHKLRVVLFAYLAQMINI